MLSSKEKKKLKLRKVDHQPCYISWENMNEDTVFAIYCNSIECYKRKKKALDNGQLAIL